MSRRYNVGSRTEAAVAIFDIDSFWAKTSTVRSVTLRSPPASALAVWEFRPRANVAKWQRL